MKTWTPELAFMRTWDDDKLCSSCPNFYTWPESHPYGETYAAETLCECKGNDEECPGVMAEANDILDQVDDLAMEELLRNNLNNLPLSFVTQLTGVNPEDAESIMNAVTYWKKLNMVPIKNFLKKYS